MNETIALPRLAEIFSAKTGITPDEAEKFIKQFFTQIENALAVTDEVNIKGFGKFQTCSIEGVSFTPDKELADFLNQPFDMFSPIEIPDEADIEESCQQSTDSSEASETANKETETTSGPETEAESSPGSDAPDTDYAPEIENVCDETASEDREEEAAATNISASDEIIIDENEPASDSDAETTDYVPETSLNTRKHTPLFGYLFTAIVCLVTGYIFHDFTQGESEETLKDTRTTINTVNETADSVKITQETKEAIVETADSSSLSEQITPAAAVEDLKVKETITDTVTPQRFLTTMARKYYGRMEYWVFIYLANEENLGNPNRIPPGTKVVIPDKNDFSKGETTEQTLERAKRLGHEIYKRFE